MRERLPNRRYHEAFTLVHWEQKFHVGVGRDARGTIKEIWISAGKTGTQAETLAMDSAVTISVALQNGAGIDELRHAIKRDLDGKATGPIGAVLDRLADEGGGAEDGQPGLPDQPRGPTPPLPSSRGEVYAD